MQAPLSHSAEAPQRSIVADILVLAALLVGLFSLIEMGREWHHPFQSKVDINLSPWYLPYYTMLSFMRGAVAYAMTFVFTLLYARWAAYDRQAERFLIPLLDILQSLPLPTFLVPLELFLVGLFPHNNIGIELSCIIVIFTGQVWNMTFSFYYSLKALPQDYGDVGKMAGLSPLQRFAQIEVPFGAKGLVYNTIISLAGGWFFLSIIEAFQIGDQDFRVKGVGSYMSVAQSANDGWAQFYDVCAVITMVVAIDQLILRPLVVWSDKFKIEDTESQHHETSEVLRYYGRSRVAVWIHDQVMHFLRRPEPTRGRGPALIRPGPLKRLLLRIPWRNLGLFVALLVFLYGAFKVTQLLTEVHGHEWLKIGGYMLLTMIRVLSAVALSTLIAVPIGVTIGLSPKLSRYLLPITQITASFPFPLVFGNLLGLIYLLHGNLEYGAVLLMMLGTIWYILFNVISGASAIPQDLRACAELNHLSIWNKWRTLYLPGIFPALTTGWITAAGGAWNASITSEFVQVGSNTHAASGLGALIAQATAQANYPVLCASILSMALFVVCFNRLVWKRLSAIAQERYQFLT